MKTFRRPDSDGAAKIARTNITMKRVQNADKLQLWLRFVMVVRGLLWRVHVNILMKSPRVGRGQNCFGWPELTHRDGSLTIGDGCFFGPGTFTVTKGAKLLIGDRVLINSAFVVSANLHVEIGNDTLIGEHVSIRDADHEFSRLDIPIASQGVKCSPVLIGEDVWIGRGSVVLKGVTIGRGAIIGANSVVTKDVAPFDIVAGSPARRIRSRLTPKADGP
jgi:carbonic anhydrase/acetyltransferase-like protein (isoleucine patch superfamily)